MTTPFGSWPSPVSARAVAESSPRLEGARLRQVPGGEEVWWGESIPAEGGRTGIRRRRADGVVETVLPAPWSARSRVHEYGGGAWDSNHGVLVFVEKTDQRVWMLAPGQEPTPLTPPDSGMRFGGLMARPEAIWAVREHHGEHEPPRRDLVTIPWDGSAATDPERVISVVAGSDFLAQPAVSARGDRLAWVAWDHPDMPWDRTSLRVGELRDGVVTRWREIAGGPERAPLQPTWVPADGEDELLYLDDPGGRWNLHSWSETSGPRVRAAADADTGGPLWVLGARWYAPLPEGGAICVQTNGSDRVVSMDARGEVTSLGGPVIAGASIEDAHATRALVAGATREGTTGLWLVDTAADVDTASGTRWERVAGTTPAWDAEWVPRATPVTAEGPRGRVYGFAFAPTHPRAVAPDDELPPYLVLVHGGPTSHVGGAPSPKITYFTSRGIGVLDVNYGGSSGYGRPYRERLRGQWGVVDVEDVAAAAAHLGATGMADPRRLAIEGGSAGGWTVLAALARTEVFAAGISRYGVGDARALAAETHDFEARYLDGLIGPLPEADAVYIERSPLTHADGFTAPMLLLQGADDEVVPPSQAESIRDALTSRGIPHAYVLYDGEGHGFRRAETLIHSLETELAFLGAALRFSPADVQPLTLGPRPDQDEAGAER